MQKVIVDLLPDVRRWVSHAVGVYDAEDVLQECVIELMDALSAFRGDAQLRTYAHRVVTRAAIRRKTKSRRLWSFFSGADSSDTTASPSRNPEQAHLHERVQMRVRGLLRELSVEHQECLVYVWVEELSHAEAAELQGVPLETFRSRLKTARAAFERAAVRDPLLGQVAEEFARSRPTSSKSLGTPRPMASDGVGRENP